MIKDRTMMRTGSIAFSLLIVIYCFWIIHLPVFPSGDGPVHVYYAEVISRILAGSAAFRDNYRIVRWFPPYCLPYYVLAFLLLLLTPVAAEKALVCLCILVPGYAFRHFARNLGPSGIAAALFALPFLMHRYLFMGFYNYSLAIGLAFVAMGLWWREERSKWSYRVAFIAAVWLTMLSHPVPVFVVLGSCAGELLVRAIARRWTSPRPSASCAATRLLAEAGDALTLVVASTSLIYIAHFTQEPSLEHFVGTPSFGEYVDRLARFLGMQTLSPLDFGYYRYGLLAALVLMFATGVRETVKSISSGRSMPAGLVLLGGLLLAFLYPCLPNQVSGGHFFAERITVLCVLLIIAGAAGREMGKRSAAVVLSAGALFSILALAVFQVRLGPVARDLSLPDRLQVTGGGAHELLVNTATTPGGLTYGPCGWAGLRVIQQDRGILMNNPWLDLPFAMLQEKDPDRVTRFGSLLNPYLLALNLGVNQALYSGLVGPADKVVVIHCSSEGTHPLTRWLQSQSPGRWSVWTTSWFDMLEPEEKRRDDLKPSPDQTASPRL